MLSPASAVLGVGISAAGLYFGCASKPFVVLVGLGPVMALVGPPPRDQSYRRRMGTQVTTNIGAVSLASYARSASCGRDGRASVQIAAVVSFVASNGFDYSPWLERCPIDQPLHHDRLGTHQGCHHESALLLRQRGVLPLVEPLGFRSSAFLNSGSSAAPAVVAAAIGLFRGTPVAPCPPDPTMVCCSPEFPAYSDCLCFV